MALRITGMASGLDTESIVTELMSAYKTKGDKYKKEQTKLSWTQDAWKSLNTKIYSFYKKAGDMRFSSAFNMKKTTLSDSSKAKVTASNSAVNGTQSLEVTDVARGGYLTGEELASGTSRSTKLSDLDPSFAGKSGTITISSQNGSSKQINISDSTTVGEFIDQLNGSGTGVKASLDTTNNRIYITSQKTGTKNDFTLTGDGGDGDTALKLLGVDASNGATKKAATNASIKLNDVTYTSDTNTFNINGLTIEALGKTDGEITVTTATDTEGIYNKFKDFLSEYNSLINEMSKLYNASSAKGYEPLTSDEKYMMSDKEVEEWETKIKDSLLRRDSTLEKVMSTMTSAMSGTVSIDGKNYGLTSLGIKTASYFGTTANERYALHIDGDSDDDSSSGNSDKLLAMLNSDPDKAIKIFQGITSDLYTKLDKQMKSTELRSAYTVYNDKEMAKNYSDYTKKIKAWDEKVESIEDSYYKKFAAMEKALTTLQGQTSSLTGMFN